MQINLLDMKRSMNVNIFLKQFKMTNDAVVELIRHGDDAKIGVEKLKGLLKILPEKDEVKKFYLRVQQNVLNSYSLLLLLAPSLQVGGRVGNVFGHDACGSVRPWACPSLAMIRPKCANSRGGYSCCASH